MKLVTYSLNDKSHLGVVRGDAVIDVNAASEGKLPDNMREFLQQGEPAMALARELLEKSTTTVSLHDVTLLAPIRNPSKVVAIGLNYMDHCRETGTPPPTTPVIFTKFTTAIVGPGAAIRWDPALTSKVDYEAELAVVFGKVTRRVSKDEALDYVAGYMNANDVSAREIQRGDGQWVRGKSLDTFCPLGPSLVTADKVPDPQALNIRSTLNGQVMQESNTREMIFDIPTLIEFASRAFTLLPGDVLITGTPHGVGIGRTPPVFMKDGDVVSVEVEGLGVLTNRCEEERLGN
jgi:2-keto-4-pentenoate hydratase/2-oxohepta-3-ene-1,7-dioic acid hydratase in catechol pathway